MTQRDNILEELRELQSSLVNAGSRDPYTVPIGYFDNLANEVLSRVRTLKTEDASEELNYLSPLLNSISREMPYTVPVDFFNELPERIMRLIKDNDEQTAEEELKTISPLLSGLKKEMPYSVPQGYFEQLNEPGNIRTVKPEAKVVSFTRQKWFRYAAAAVVIGFIAIGGLLFLNKGGSSDPKTQPTEWVKKNMKKVSADDIDNFFIQLTNEESPVVASIDTKSEIIDKNDVQELIKDIPDKDIQNFLDDTQAGEQDNDDILMN